MADLNSKYNINTQEAVKNTATLSKSIDKVEASAKKSAAAIDKMNKAASSGGGGGGRYPNGHPGRGGGSLTGVAGFVPGGASAQSQFRNIFRAIGIAGLGTVMKQLNDSIIANTKALLDRAKEQQNQAKLNTLTDSQLKSNKVIVDELNKRNKNLKEGEIPKTFYDIRNELSVGTGSTTDEINSIFKTFADNVRNFEELKTLTTEIVMAAKLGVSDISTLIDAEQKALAIKGQTPGASTKSMGILAEDFKNVYMNIIDEIQGSKDIGMGTGIAKFYGDTKGEYKIEESMQKLNALMEENSLQGLRKYGGKQLEGKSGPDFLDALVQFTNERAKDIGITGEQTIDRYVERGDMSKEEADVFKEIYKNFDEFKNYLNTFDVQVDFGISSTQFKDKVDSFIQPFLDAAGTIPNPNYNKSFAQSIESDVLKSLESVKISSPSDTPATAEQTAQNEFTKMMSEKGFDRLREGPEGQIPMTPYNEFLNFSTKNLENSFKPIGELSDYIDEKNKPLEDFIDSITSVPKGWLESLTRGIFGEGTAGNIATTIAQTPLNITGGVMKLAGKGPLAAGFQNTSGASLSELPILNSLSDYAKTQSYGPGKVEFKNEKGETETEYTLGPAINSIIDLLGIIAGGLGGGKAAGGMADNVAKKVLGNLDSIKNIDTGIITKVSKDISLLDEENKLMAGYLERTKSTMAQANRESVLFNKYVYPIIPEDDITALHKKNLSKKILDEEQYLGTYQGNIDKISKEKTIKETQLADAQKLQTKLEASQKSWEGGTNKTAMTWAGRVVGGYSGGSITRDGVNLIGGNNPDKDNLSELNSLINNPMQFNQNLPTATSNMNNDEFIQNLTGSSPAPETSPKQENGSFVNDFTASQKVRDEIALRQLKVQEELLAETKRKSTQDQLEFNKNANKPYNRNQFR